METPMAIRKWGQETFNQPSQLDLVARLVVEAAELFSAVIHEASREKIIEELADVAIVHIQLGSALEALDYTAWAPIDPSNKQLAPRNLLAQVSQLMSATAHAGSCFAEGATADDYLHAHRDVLMNVRHCARILATDLHKAITAKMRVNRARKWGLTDTNRYQHVPSKPSPGRFSYPQETHECSTDRWYLVDSLGRLWADCREGFDTIVDMVTWCAENDIPVRIQYTIPTEYDGAYGMTGAKLIALMQHPWSDTCAPRPSVSGGK